MTDDNYDSFIQYVLPIFQESSRFEELYQFLCLCCPLGSPLETDASTVSAVLQSSKFAKNVPVPKTKVGL